MNFIILRHARCISDHLLGLKCYESIRKFYKENLIVILDDSSSFRDFSIFTSDPNCRIIESTIPGAGESLPWFYAYHLNLANDYVCFLHDSMAITRPLIENLNYFIWTFPKECDLGAHTEVELVQKLRNVTFDDLVSNESWKGCFGCTGVLHRDILKKCAQDYGLFDISFVSSISNRTDRMAFERIFGYCMSECGVRNSLQGCIFDFPYAFNPPQVDANLLMSYHLVYKPSAVVKVWLSR